MELRPDVLSTPVIAAMDYEPSLASVSRMRVPVPPIPTTPSGIKDRDERLISVLI
jgi:hypothetical protein